MPSGTDGRVPIFSRNVETLVKVGLYLFGIITAGAAFYYQTSDHFRTLDTEIAQESARMDSFQQVAQTVSLLNQERLSDQQDLSLQVSNIQSEIQGVQTDLTTTHTHDDDVRKDLQNLSQQVATLGAKIDAQSNQITFLFNRDWPQGEGQGK
jgi:peptidoglycan hydrolase CwlO-like protein